MCIRDSAPGPRAVRGDPAAHVAEHDRGPAVRRQGRRAGPDDAAAEHPGRVDAHAAHAVAIVSKYFLALGRSPRTFRTLLLLASSLAVLPPHPMWSSANYSTVNTPSHISKERYPVASVF